MADALVMLALSPTMDEGQLVKWLKSEGDVVESGDVVAEVETDKATMELESFLDGVMLKRLVTEGSMVKVGTPIAIIGEEGDDLSEWTSGGAAAQPAAPSALAPASAPAAAAQPAAPSAPVVAQAAATPAPQSAGGRIVASPLARKLAEESGLDLAAITGSGPHGRIIKRDIEEARTRAPKRGASERKPLPQGPWAEDVTPAPLSGMRRVIAQRLQESWVTAPHFFLEMAIRMDAAAKLRGEMNEALLARGQKKVSFNDMVVKACALALLEVPEVNVAFADDGMRSFSSAHIGVAVAVPDGLVVPVVRDAQTLTLSEISAQTRDLAGRARDKKLKPHEMTGSTFSISNLGMFGIDAFTAVINPPEACILAVGAVSKQPVVGANDQLEVGRVMRVTLSCDHRAVDGALGARFLGVVREYLESPLLLLV